MSEVGGEWRNKKLPNGDLIWEPVDSGAKQICKERGIPYIVLMKNEAVSEALPAMNESAIKKG